MTSQIIEVLFLNPETGKSIRATTAEEVDDCIDKEYTWVLATRAVIAGSGIV